MSIKGTRNRYSRPCLIVRSTCRPLKSLSNLNVITSMWCLLTSSKNDDVESSKRCAQFFSLVFITKCLTKSIFIRKVSITLKIFGARNKSLYRSEQDSGKKIFVWLNRRFFVNFQSYFFLQDREKRRLGIVTSFQDSLIRSRSLASTGCRVNICFILLTKKPWSTENNLLKRLASSDKSVD